MASYEWTRAVRPQRHCQVNIIEDSYHGFDADTRNPFVQKVVEERMKQIREMLK